MATLMSTAVTSTAYRITKTVTGVRCDVCKKIIPVPTGRADDRDIRYYVITTGHNDWGNDSCESIEIRDVCPDCAPKYISDYLEENIDSNTAYIRVESEDVWAEKTSTVVDTPPADGETVVKQHDYF